MRMVFGENFDVYILEVTNIVAMGIISVSGLIEGAASKENCN